MSAAPFAANGLEPGVGVTYGFGDRAETAAYTEDKVLLTSWPRGPFGQAPSRDAVERRIGDCREFRAGELTARSLSPSRVSSDTRPDSPVANGDVCQALVTADGSSLAAFREPRADAGAYAVLLVAASARAHRKPRASGCRPSISTQSVEMANAYSSLGAPGIRWRRGVRGRSLVEERGGAETRAVPESSLPASPSNPRD